MPGSSVVRVAVMNDYSLVVRGLAAMLAPFEPRIQVVELDSQLPVESSIDVLLYDTFTRERVVGPVRDVLEQTDAPVVVYTWHADRELVRESLELGVAGWVSKTATAEELVEVLERVAAGEVVSPVGDEADDPADEMPANSWPGRDLGLSPREAEVLALIAQGLTNREIAERAYVSPNTVKTFIRTAYRKIGVQRRSQAVAWAAGHGFLPDSERWVRDEGGERPGR